MIYAKLFADDINIIATTNGVMCQMCSFGDLMESNFLAESTQEMVDHVLAHAKKGDVFPSNLIDSLWADDATNYPNKKA